jgi:agmatinase
MPQQSASHYLRHGQTPFFRLPVADVSLPGADAYAAAHAVLLGVPYDGGTTYQPGARLAPYHVRRVSALVQGYHPEHRVDVFEKLRVLDGGNVAFPPFNPQLVRELIDREVTRVYSANAVPFVVGGDHSISLPCLRAASAKHGSLAVIHVDAHADTSSGEIWGERYHHGTPMRHALEENLIARGQLYQIGLRGPWSSPEDGAFAGQHGATVVTADEVSERGVIDVVSEVLHGIGERPVYLTFDIDAIDPAFAPGTGTPVPGGLSSREAVQLVRHLAGIRLIGMDVVEVSPPHDHSDLTSHLAAHLLYEGLALLVAR